MHAGSSRTPRLVLLSGFAAIVLVAGSLALILGGGFGGGSTPPLGAVATTFGPTVASHAPSAAGGSVGDGSSRPPSQAFGNHAVRMRVDRLGIDLPITEGDGIDAPVGKAAHYPGTAWPGEGSNIYLYGHARTGSFIGLWEIHKGDEVVLQLADHQERTYVVSQIIPKVAWDAVEYLDPTASEQLTLQTCTSDKPTSPRFIVIALPNG